MPFTLLKNFIHGRYVDNSDNARFDVINPSTGQAVYAVERACGTLLAQAVKSAQEGVKIWSKTPAIERARILQRAAAILRERNDELAKIEVIDTGKPWQEVVEADVLIGADAIEYFVYLCPSIMGEHQCVCNDFFST